MTLQNNNGNMESVVKKDQNDQEIEGEVQIYNLDNNLLSESRKRIKWWLFLLNCFMLVTGTVGGPLMIRFYYQHGGTRKWIPAWLQSAGFPVLFFPLVILHYRHKNQLNTEKKQGREREREPNECFAGPKLLLYSAGLGLINGIDNFMYAFGLSYLPLSTSTILIATQLAFTAICALILVKQKFTPLSINAVVLMTLGSILLGLRKSGDRPANVTQGQYLYGFAMTLGAAAILGIYFPLVELAYAKGAGKKRITYFIVTQVQIGVGLFATIFSTIGMIVNHDFKVLSKEAKVFDLGETNYYVVLVFTAIAFQLWSIGSLGVIFCSSSLFCGILSTAMIAVTEVVAAIVFKEKFSGEKVMSLVLCLWGVISYFYGAHITAKKIKQNPETITDSNSTPRKPESDSHSPV